MLLFNELFVENYLIKGEEPLLLDIIRVSEKPEHFLVGLYLNHVDPAIARLFRGSKLNWAILVPTLHLNWASIEIVYLSDVGWVPTTA